MPVSDGDTMLVMPVTPDREDPSATGGDPAPADAAIIGWSYRHPLVLARHRTTAMLISGACLFLLCWLDYVTGYEFGFFIFYFIPVAFAAWYGGRKEGVAMAVLCGICWYVSDRLTHHPYSRPYFIYWETFMRLVSFLTTSLTLSRIRDLVLNEERLMAELLAAREELTICARRRASTLLMLLYSHK